MLTIVPKPTIDQVADIALAAVPSAISRLSYRGYMRKFLAFHGPNQLTREGVGNYLAWIRNNGASLPVIRQNMKAIRVLANELKYRGALTDLEHEGICAIKLGGTDYLRAGNWLAITDVRALLALPDKTTAKGLQASVVLGLLVGCGLRRAEVAELTWGVYQQRDGRMCLVDFRGKGNKIRTVPVPGWLQADMDAYRALAGGDKIAGMGRVNIWYTVAKHIKLLAKIPGHEHCAGVAPHDLRRTLAKLMRDAGVSLEQITATLGHSSLTTTQIYLGTRLMLKPGQAGVDQVEIVCKP